MSTEREQSARSSGLPVTVSEGSRAVKIALGKGPVKVTRSFAPERRVGVTPAGNDDLAAVLRRVKVRFETIPDEQLCDRGSLARFSTLFLNCSSAAQLYAVSAGDALRDWVRRGGSLFASDWAGAYIHAAFPRGFDGEQCGCTNRVGAAVTDGELRRVLGTARLHVELDMPSWYRVRRFAPPEGAGSVYLAEGRCPLMLSFKYGRGQVAFTSFHNRAQPGQVIEKLLNFLVLVPVVRNIEVASHVVRLTGGDLERYLMLNSGNGRREES